MINWITGTVEGPTKHLNTHWHSQDITCEFASR
jgi:hypothetical protein